MFPLQLTNFALIHFQLVSCNISIKNVCVCVWGRQTDRERQRKRKQEIERQLCMCVWKVQLFIMNSMTLMLLWAISSVFLWHWIRNVLLENKECMMAFSIKHSLCYYWSWGTIPLPTRYFCFGLSGLSVCLWH